MEFFLQEKNSEEFIFYCLYGVLPSAKFPLVPLLQMQKSSFYEVFCLFARLQKQAFFFGLQTKNPFKFEGIFAFDVVP